MSTESGEGLGTSRSIQIKLKGIRIGLLILYLSFLIYSFKYPPGSLATGQGKVRFLIFWALIGVLLLINLRKPSITFKSLAVVSGCELVGCTIGLLISGGTVLAIALLASFIVFFLGESGILLPKKLRAFRSIS